MTDIVRAPPKRSKKKIIELSTSCASDTPIVPETQPEKKQARGRKSKVMSPNAISTIQPTIPVTSANIILHLKCCMQDLREYNSQYNYFMTNPMEYNPSIPPSIMTYNEVDNSIYFSKYDKNDDAELTEPTVVTSATVMNDTKTNESIHAKIKKLKIYLYKNGVSQQSEEQQQQQQIISDNCQSACFWCTYEFDTPAFYIPKYETEDAMHAYGSFCSPNCAAAYLLNENINDSIRFERYSLLNWIYSNGKSEKIYPAPNPYYTLQKYYGNLTIQEYRKLTQSDQHRLIVLDRPLTRILPELHEETYATTRPRIQLTTTQTGEEKGMGGFRVRKESERVQRSSKSDIVRDRFGLQKKT
jgi:hypothetical protein